MAALWVEASSALFAWMEDPLEEPFEEEAFEEPFATWTLVALEVLAQRTAWQDTGRIASLSPQVPKE